MLKELSTYENLGTPSYFLQLLRTLRDNPDEKWKITNIGELFHNRVIDDRNIFDGCLPLLNSIGIIKINADDEIIIDGAFLKYLESETQMLDRLVECLLLSVNSDPIFQDIFCSEYFSYDIIYRAVQIDNSAFPLRYSCFKQLMIDFTILQEHPAKKFNKYMLNTRYKKIFDKVVSPEIRKRKIGVAALHMSLEQNQIYGEEAERFVLEYEKLRLNGAKEITWVAEYSVSDGYDIASYETEDSKDHDRFIEVKSYNKAPYFFWSRNEINIARIKKSHYFLYLVDRSMMKLPGYIPIMIKDPFENVYQNNAEWEKRTEMVRLQKIIPVHSAKI